MSNNSNSVPNAISTPVLIAFIISTAIFSSILTLSVTWIVLHRRRRLKHRNALLQAKRRTQFLQDPETPPMRTKSIFPPSLVVSPLYNARNSKSDSSPSSYNSSESVGRRGSYALVEASSSPPPAALQMPVEMMGSTTWSKGELGPKPLGRQSSRLQ